MDRGFIPADKVLSEMRRVAMADFMRWWRSDEKRDAIGDLIFWTEIDETARRCRGEGERKRYRFGIKKIKLVQKRFVDWGTVSGGLGDDYWTPKDYAVALKRGCSEEAYKKMLRMERIDRIAASLIRNGENEFLAEEWAARQWETGRDIVWEDWKAEWLGETYEDPNEENPFLQ